MKKLTSMLAMLALCGGAVVSATVVNPGVRTDLKVTGITQKFQKLLNAGATAADQVETRSYVTAGGNIYEATFQLYQQPLCEMVTFSDANGQPYQPEFEDMPFYAVNYELMMWKPEDISPSTYVRFVLAWPSQYIYDQVWSWTGETEDIDGQMMIPVALREFQPASFEDLWNNADRCRLFIESEGIGTGDPVAGKWSYYTMLPNELLGITALYNGKGAVTYIDAATNTQSQILLQQFDSEELYMEMENKLWLLDSTQTPRSPKVAYKGTGDVQGFVHTSKDLGEFGDMHLFNGGIISSELYGDENPFPTDFGPMTQMYYAIGDPKAEWELDPKATKFDPSYFVLQPFEMTPEETRKYANFMTGYLYMDEKYGKDINLNPDQNDTYFRLAHCETVDIEGADDWYTSVTPEVGTIIPFGVTYSDGSDYEPWSKDFGSMLYVAALPQVAVNTPVYFGWGFTDGYVLNYENEFLNTIRATSKGKLYYHYDPEDMKLFRELELVGSKNKDSVETVTAETAKISAANGVITVAVAENAEVAVYALDGICVKNVKAIAGETVNVEAQKGIYVVTVNGASRKVAL